MKPHLPSWLGLTRLGALLTGTLALLLLGACHTAKKSSENAKMEKVTEAVQAANQAGQAPVKAQTLDEKPIMVNQVAPDKASDTSKEGALPVRKMPAATTSPATTATGAQPAGPVVGPKPGTTYPNNLVKGIKDPDAKVKVLFNFDAAPVTEVVPLFGSLLNFSYLIDPAIKGSVTMTVDTEMTAREVWAMFEEILWLSGGYASRNPGYVHVLPLSKMPQERRLLGRYDPAANVEVAMLPVYQAKSADLVAALTPFKTEGATITDFPRLNSLLIVEAPANMAKLRELVVMLDGKGEAGWPQSCIRCQKVDAEIVRDELMALLPVLGLPVTDKASTGGEIKITALPRLQAIIVSAALPEVVEEVERWVRALDQENLAEQENIFFYNVRHSTAEHLAEGLGVFFNTSGLTSTAAESTKSTSSKASGSGSGYGSGSSSSSNRNNQGGSFSGTSSAGSRSSTGQNRSGQQLPGRTGDQNSKENGAPKTVFDTPVTLYADSDQNRLTIRTTPRAYAMVEALLKRLDVPPRQVLIQAILAEITLNKTTEYGFAYAAKFNLDGYDATWMSNGLPSIDKPFGATGPVDPFGLAGKGFFLGFKKNDVMGFIRAVAGNANVRVLSAPQIMAVNDQEAVINVGEQVPVRTGDDGYTDSSTTANYNPYSTNSYTYIDTGIVLTVTPHITAGNVVKMDIRQEKSDPIKTESSNIDSPTIRTRTLETKLVVPDGATVLMGGLIRTDEAEVHTGIPLLMDIPWLGALFRTNATESRRSELLVVVTVTMVDETSDVDKLAYRYKNAVHEIRKQMGK
jgi:general secretion pathway protein D